MLPDTEYRTGKLDQVFEGNDRAGGTEITVADTELRRPVPFCGAGWLGLPSAG